MSTLITEEVATTPAEKPRASQKARVGAQRGHVTPKKTKSQPKAKTSKKAPKAPNKTEGGRDGSKAAKVLELLKRPEGVSMKELLKATGWQAHSVRGFLSGAIRKKMGLTVTSTKGEEGERTYSVKS
jgi:uncharacterized protein DUF3489